MRETSWRFISIYVREHAKLETREAKRCGLS